MKVERPQEPRQVEPPKQPFGDVLRKAKPPQRAGPATPAPVTPKSPAPPRQTVTRATPLTTQAARSTTPGSVTNAPAQQLTRARVHVDAEATRLGAVRSDHSQAATAMTQARTARGEQLDEKQTAKLMDALTQEFSKEPAPQPIASAFKLEPQQGSAPAKVDAPPETKAAQATALIEKIEHFVRSNRPGLSLTLNNSLGVRVELERLGPKELSVKLYGRPGAEAVSRIREELRARGLNATLIVA